MFSASLTSFLKIFCVHGCKQKILIVKLSCVLVITTANARIGMHSASPSPVLDVSVIFLTPHLR